MGSRIGQGAYQGRFRGLVTAQQRIEPARQGADGLGLVVAQALNLVADILVATRQVKGDGLHRPPKGPDPPQDPAQGLGPHVRACLGKRGEPFGKTQELSLALPLAVLVFREEPERAPELGHGQDDAHHLGRVPDTHLRQPIGEQGGRDIQTSVRGKDADGKAKLEPEPLRRRADGEGEVIDGRVVGVLPRIRK